MSTLLALAVAQLGQGDPHANRRAAWFARAALEDVVDELLAERQLTVNERASGRAKLSCLEALYRDDHPDLVAHAEYAWARLSEACHQHAYELTPTYIEVRHLVELVGDLGRSDGSR